MPSGVYERTKQNRDNISQAVKNLWYNTKYAITMNAHIYVHRYTSDFYLPQFNMYVETKDYSDIKWSFLQQKSEERKQIENQYKKTIKGGE
jgi:hypothetical protein